MTLLTASSPRITARLAAVAGLSRPQRASLFALYRSLFEGASETTFLHDLEGKDQVILLEEGERLAGFSTLKRFTHEHEGRSIAILFSGDTVVEPSAWTSTAGLRLWVATALSLRRISPDQPLYWLLLAGSYRTYRTLPILFRSFFPRPGASTPSETRALRDSVSLRMFGAAYDRGEGIVRFPGAPRLRHGAAELSEERRREPHIAFYLRSNPAFEAGDELVCLAEISRENLSPAGLRMLR